MKHPRLQIERLTKSFFGVRVLHEVSFAAYAGEVLGIVGENGSGKSTAMNVLAGVIPSDAGTMLLDGQAHAPKNRREADAAGVAFIQQELSIFANLTVAQNLFLGRFPRLTRALPIISAKKMNIYARELLSDVNLEVEPTAAAGTLSTGERQQLEIARGLAVDARVMIFDEPTSSLTQREVERLFAIIARLKARGVAIIFISHALEDVLRLADRVVVMRDGQGVRCMRNVGVSTHDLIVAMVGRAIGTLFPERPTRTGVNVPLLEVENVTEPGAVAGVSFHINPGEIVGLAGLMGSGRSELARILFGLDPHREGFIRVGGQPLPSGQVKARINAGVAFLTEDRRGEGLMMEASVAANMELAALPLFAQRIDRRIEARRLANAIQGLAGRLNLKSGPGQSTWVRTLSGGNQQKVVLGRWILRLPALFILDEPTRGVDIGAKEEIYRLLAELAETGMAILIISSELEELIGLSDRILVMRRGRLQGHFVRAEFDPELLLKAAFGHERVA
jgi:ribose transport system ATP-binding protein